MGLAFVIPLAGTEIESKNHFSVVVSAINESRPPRFANRKRRQA